MPLAVSALAQILCWCTFVTVGGLVLELMSDLHPQIAEGSLLMYALSGFDRCALGGTHHCRSTQKGFPAQRISVPRLFILCTQPLATPGLTVSSFISSILTNTMKLNLI